MRHELANLRRLWHAQGIMRDSLVIIGWRAGN